MSDDDAKRSSRKDTEAKGKKQRRLEVSAKRVTGSSSKKEALPKAQDVRLRARTKTIERVSKRARGVSLDEAQRECSWREGFPGVQVLAGTEQPRGPWTGGGHRHKEHHCQVPSLLGRAKGRFVLQLAALGGRSCWARGSRALLVGCRGC